MKRFLSWLILSILMSMLSTSIAAAPPALTASNLRWDQVTMAPIWDLNMEESLVRDYSVSYYYSSTNTMPTSPIWNATYHPDKKPLTMPDWFLKDYGYGYYWFTVQVFSADTTKASDSVAHSVPSQAFHYVGPTQAAPAPTDLLWHVARQLDTESSRPHPGAASYKTTATSYHTYFRVDFYRQEPTGDVHLQSLFRHMEHFEQYDTIYPAELAPEMFQTGSYYFTVINLGDGQTTVDSQPVKSPIWHYVRPATSLQVSNPVLGNDMSISWDTDSHTNLTNYYLVEFSFSSKSNDILTSKELGTIRYDSATDAFIDLDSLKNGNGWYFFRVKAISADVSIALSSQWTDWSAGVYYTAPVTTLEINNLGWNQTDLTLTWNLNVDASLVGYYDVDFYYSYYPHLSETPIHTVRYYPTDAPFSIPSTILENYGNGYYWFTVRGHSSDLTKVSNPYINPGYSPHFYFRGFLEQLPAPYDLQWHVNRQVATDAPTPYPGASSFGYTLTGGSVRFRMDFYRQETTGDVFLRSLDREMNTYPSVQYETFCLPQLRPELFTTGSYYFTVTALGDGTTTSDSQTVKSPIWNYIRPALSFDATNLSWDGLSPRWSDNVQNAEQVAYYEISYYFSTKPNARLDINDSCFIANYRSNELPAAIPDFILNRYGNGYYYFRVRIVSNDPHVAVSSQCSEQSPAYYHLPSVPAPSAPQWHIIRTGNGKSTPKIGAASFSGTVTSDYYSSFRVDFYRQEPAGDVYLDSLTAHITKGFQYSTVNPLLDLPELFTTGSYYFTVTALGDGINTSDSQPVKSPVWDYIHPGLTLNATALAWDGTNLLWTDNAQNPEQVHGYNIQYFYNAIANAPIDLTVPVAHSYCSSQDLPASLDVDLPLHYDTGYFYFRVQVESADPNVAATGEWSELSPALFKVGMYPKVHEAHDLRWDVERHYADQKSRPASGAISFGSMVTGTPTDFRVDFYRQETTGDMYLGSSTVQIGADQQYGTAYILDAVTQPLITGSYYCLVTTLGEPYVTSSSLPVQSSVWEYQTPILADNFGPYELQWNVKRRYSYENPVPYSGAASFSGTVANGNYDLFQVDFYRQDAAGDIYLDTLLTKFYADERYCTVYPLEEFPELFTTGSYYFVVWEEGPVSSNSQPVKSPIWNYTRPAVTLQASNPVWSSDMSMNWASLSDTTLLDYFEVEIRYNHWGNDLGNSRIVDTAKYNNPNVRPNDDALSAGEGWYFFRVRAQSSDINAATNSAWSDWSAGYHYTQSYNKLGTPSELKWHAARDQEGNEITFMGSIDFKRADPDQGCYDVWFYRAGEEAPVTADRWTFDSNDTQQYLSVSAFIYEDLPSGTYYFKIRAVGDSTNYIHGEWVTSDTWVYRTPATRLETPSNLHWDDSLYGGTDIYIMWESAEADVYYESEVYFSATENGPKVLLHGSRGLHKTETKLRDEVLEECGNGWYFVRVRAVPEDITQMRISEWSEFSPGYHMTQLSIDVSAALEAINPNAPLADIQQAVAAIPHLNQAMAADKENSGAVKRIAALENTMGKTTVNITATTVGFDASGVQVTGAVLNAGADATLEIGSVSTSTVLPALTPTQYNNTVTFTLDIPQAEDQNPAVAGLQLAVPVKITLPIPDNINPAFLVVLHYQQSTGAWEELQWPHVYQDGSKWFVTFVADSMSPFALAEHLVEVSVVAGGVLLNAYLPTAGENMQFLCALYRSNGQMIGTTILDPHNESGKLISANNITADMYVKILSVDTGDGWKPVSAAQKVVITF